MSETLRPEPAVTTIEFTPLNGDVTEHMVLPAGDVTRTNPGAPESSNEPNLIDELKFAYHGFKAARAEKSRERAGSRMEKMEHKEALYAHLGGIATGRVVNVQTASGEIPRPRSAIERRFDKRIDKRAEKRSFAATYAYQVEKNHGPRDEAPGFTERDRKMVKQVIGREVRLGNMTAAEARRAKTRTDAQPAQFGELMHKRTSKNLRKATGKTNRSISQPIASRWRSARRESAVDAIKVNHKRAEKHRRIQDEIVEKFNQQAEPPQEEAPITEPITVVPGNLYDWETDEHLIIPTPAATSEGRFGELLAGAGFTAGDAVVDPINYDSLGDEDEPRINFSGWRDAEASNADRDPKVAVPSDADGPENRTNPNIHLSPDYVAPATSRESTPAESQEQPAAAPEYWEFLYEGLETGNPAPSIMMELLANKSRIKTDYIYSGGMTIPGTDEWIPGKKTPYYSYETTNAEGDTVTIPMDKRLAEKILETN